MTKQSASKESKFPWDPLWEFVSNEKSGERKNAKVTNPLRRKSREKYSDEIRDEDGSGRLVSGAKTLNETREIPTQTPCCHVELDKSYFDESEAEMSVPSNRLDKRKVHFSPFKNVVLVEDSSFDDPNPTSIGERKVGCNGTWDANDVPSALSLGEFLQTWKEHLVDFDDSIYESTVNLVDTTTTHENSLYDSAATESFQSFATLSTSIDEDFSMHDTDDLVKEDKHANNTQKACLERNLSNCVPLDSCDERKATEEYNQRDTYHQNTVWETKVIEPLFDKESRFIPDSKLVAQCHANILDRDCQPKDEFKSSPYTDNEWSSASWDFLHQEKNHLNQSTFQEKSIQNHTSHGYDTLTQTSDVNSKRGTAWDEIIPKSLFQNEYDEELHMFLSFKTFGLEEGKLEILQRLQKPSIPCLEQGTSSNVVISVEASSISHTDVLIRQGDWRSLDEISLPCTPGVDFVGRVHEIDPVTSRKTGFVVGDQVMSLCTTGGNARYVLVDHQSLVRVPAAIDAALATCLPETYLAAFQALHNSQSNSTRYKKTSLRGKAILVIGSITSNLGRAVAELSHGAGARVVYGIAEPKHHQLLQALNIVPIPSDGADCEEVDIIVSLDQEVDVRFSRLLKWYGEIVIICERQILARSKDVGTKPLFCSRKKSQASSKTTRYDVHQQWKSNRELCKKDLCYLLMMLENDEISPYIIDRIPLEKVAKVHEFIGTKRLSGFLVCAPWSEKNPK